MKRLFPLLLFFMLGVNSFGIAQDLFKTSKEVRDSMYFKNKGVYVVLCPLGAGTSINTDNNYHYSFIAARLSINWRTKKHRKFAWFAQMGTGGAPGSKPLNIYETGFLIGKLISGKRRGFFDMNIGLAAIGRKADEPQFTLGWGPSPPSLEEVREIHTVGIPLDVSVNTSRGVVGIGVGVCGNINLNQPYVACNLRVRFGNPIRTKHSSMM